MVRRQYKNTITAFHTEMIHKDNVHSFNKIILYSMFKMIRFLFVDVAIRPMQTVTGKLLLKIIINILVLHKFELLATCCVQEAHESNVDNLLQLQTQMSPTRHTTFSYTLLLPK